MMPNNENENINEIVNITQSEDRVVNDFYQ